MNKFRGLVLDTFNGHTDVVLSLLEKSIGSESGIDFAGLMFKYTLDSVGKIAFGHDIGSLHHEEGVEFANDFDYVQEMTNQSFLDPIWWLKRYLTPSGWRYFACLRRINTYSYAMVKKVRQEAEDAEALARANGSSSSSSSSSSSTSSGGKNLIGLYLERQADGSLAAAVGDELTNPTTNSSNPNPNNSFNSSNADTLSDTDLRDIIMNFIIGGRYTTAQALSWTFYRLCLDPETQILARKEVMSIISNSTDSKDSKSWIPFEKLKEMKYLDALCKEVLRLHPSVPKEAKHAVTDDTLPDGTKIKANDLVVFCPWVMGRSENIWENCEAFKPERFLDGPKPSSYKFTAFQAGPRICLGQDLALLEMKCCIARLLSNFEFTLAQSKESVTYLNTLTLPIKGGLLLRVNKINNL